MIYSLESTSSQGRVCKKCNVYYQPKIIKYYTTETYECNYLRDYCSFRCAGHKALDYPLQNPNCHNFEELEEYNFDEENLILILCSRNDEHSFFSKNYLPLDVFKIIFNSSVFIKESNKNKIEKCELEIQNCELEIQSYELQIQSYKKRIFELKNKIRKLKMF